MKENKTSKKGCPTAKHTLKSLIHNGIYVPSYDYKEFSIKIRGHPIKLTSKTEQMAIAWVRKAQSTVSPPDKILYKNFIQDFLTQLRVENPSTNFLEQFAVEHLRSIDKNDFQLANCLTDAGRSEIDFSEITLFLEREKQKKLNMDKTEKKRLTQQRKEQREALREKFGYATVDGRRIEIANWTAEPSCIFAGRGDHPRRGKWKEGPREEDIILNLKLPPDSPKPLGKWKDIVWEPESMYIAKWEDKLTEKIKYVWFSDSAFLKQKREKEKFAMAEKLGKLIPTIEEHITKNLDADESDRRKTATVCWLIFALNMRVGDEKDPGEADTVGAITLRPEHIRIEGDTIHFDFLGKDAVRWVKSVKAPSAVVRNMEGYSKTCKEFLFEGLDSRKVSRFLFEKMKGLTAKVFRTWRTTKAVQEHLEKCKITRENPDYSKLLCAKMANLEGAKIANHKRKIPQNFDERLAKKEARLKELELQMKEKMEQGKSTDALAKRMEKTKVDVELTKETKEYNLGTSLKSYIDPKVFVQWANKVDFPLEKLYPKTLQKKYSWALKIEAD